MIASLVHDLGQFPLAHEIEEIDRGIEHEAFTALWLDNPTRDLHGRTLREIIENQEWGWGITVDRVKAVLSARPDDDLFPTHELRETMLASIIDGPVDVDKLDYLIRDSQNAGLTYGDLIDVDRLVRSLTVVIHRHKGACVLTIGTYEKGQSAAESLSFARYLLYQALYWHRIARSVRAMLRAAISTIGQQLPKKGAGKASKTTFRGALEELLGISSVPAVLTSEDVLDFIEEAANGGGKELIRSIKARNYYKRLVTIHSEPEGTGRPTLLERFREASANPKFNEALQNKIREKLAAHLAQTQGPAASSLAPERANEVLEILGKPGMILCDCPKPPYGSDDILRFIPEPQRFQHNYFSRVEVGERVSEVWQQVFFRLMNIAAKGRVFCDPRIRDTLMAAIGPDAIRSQVEELAKKYSTQPGF
jgi:HD superfamily phosphohydrolase